jgi:hypothetical protein
MILRDDIFPSRRESDKLAASQPSHGEHEQNGASATEVPGRYHTSNIV